MKKNLKKTTEQQECADVLLPGKKKSKRKWIFLALGTVTLCAAAFGLYRLFWGEEEQVALTAFTTQGSLVQAIEGTGTTTPADSVTYSPVSFDAEILEVCVKAGDKVEVGDLLFRQDDAAVDEQIADYRDEINDYQLELEDYQETLQELNEAMANLVVYAPFSGRITGVNVKAGDNVTSGSRLCTLTDDSVLELTQYVSYAYEDLVYTGMPAYVSVASQMLQLTGTVTAIDRIEYITAEGMRCFSVTVAVSNPNAITEGTAAAAYLQAANGSSIYPAESGSFTYAESETLSAEAAGEIALCSVSDYQWVTKGEVLFTIDSDTYEKQAESARNQIEHLTEKIAALEESIADAEESREDYIRTSEIAGTVISCTLEEGLSRNIMMQSVTVYSMDTMTISVNIDELDQSSVYEGQEVTIIQSGSESSTRYNAYVSYLSLEARSSNGVATFPCTITIESEGKLTAGVNVSYVISTGDTEEGVLAPIAALKTTDQGTCLFVKAESRPENAIDLEGTDIPTGFYAVPVEVGSTNASYARILSGVEADVEVFTRYQQQAPSNGDSTSANQDTSGDFGGMPNFGGEMPNFNGGGMPNFGSGSQGNMPGGSGMPGGR